MATRKSIYCLDTDELDRFINALLTLKQSGDFLQTGTYDWFTRVHVEAMTTCRPMANERCFSGGLDPRRPTGRNSAHQGPAFLPWHRQFLIDVEAALQNAAGDPDLGIPYWPWDQDGTLANPESAPLWSSTFIGGDGDPGNGDFIQDGPFRDWDALLRTESTDPDPSLRFVYRSRLGLCRRLGRDPDGSPSLFNGQLMEITLSQSVYDSDPWDQAPPNLRPGYRDPNEYLHNQVHGWVGGDMLPTTSPNDPVFYLHHCNVDRLWAEWQQGGGAGVPYVPDTPGPPGHVLNDVMLDLGTSTSVTPASVYDHLALGYDYEPPACP